MKQIIRLEEAEAFLSAAVEIWNVEDEDAQEKFEEVISEIKKEYDLYETFEEYKEVMQMVYQIKNPSYEDYEDDIENGGLLVKRLTPTEVFFDIDDLVIRVKIIDCPKHTRIEIA